VYHVHEAIDKALGIFYDFENEMLDNDDDMWDFGL
jgi:hypothetical protein